MTKTVKCGEFMMKDGVIFYRPGKKFVVPELPKKMKAPYPENMFGMIFETDDIEQMNSLKEQEWKRAHIRQHRQMMIAYAKKEMGKKTQKSVRCVCHAVKGVRYFPAVIAHLWERSRN